MQRFIFFYLHNDRRSNILLKNAPTMPKTKRGRNKATLGEQGVGSGVSLSELVAIFFFSLEHQEDVCQGDGIIYWQCQFPLATPQQSVKPGRTGLRE